ncbi:MAG TPA: dihydrolipoamide acetyltransferase family protein, partial [Jatrophihabitantaceae bacterium]|nr:dihydrolipoamide acetyltransferase family protein [Jatrophihabitantaceae bacterium]
DTVTVNQIIVEVETAKAAVELPSPYAGVVTELHAAEGETVDVGRPIITIDVAPQSDSGSDAPPTVASEPQSPVEAPPERQSVLVGYGPRAGGTTSRRPRKQPMVDTPPVETPSANPAFNVTPTPTPAEAPEARHRVLAKPPVRKLAKTLGVDLDTVAPTGPNGSVSREDIEQAASAPTESAPAVAPAVPTGRETRIPIKGVRKHTAAAMVASAFTAPHVTEFITIDVTPMMELRERVAARSEFRDVKVSPLLFVAKAVLLAAKRTPEINASWDDAAGEIVLKHYVNLGIAAATDRGLIVPNIKDADQLSLVDLARAIVALTETARAGKTSPAEMSGGSITITNIGVFGIDTGTPILNPGEAGIVAFGAIRKMPWVTVDGHGADVIVPRWVTQLSVSFDHRIVDGQQGSQFLADVAAVLADPAMALLL